eukprot:g60727.t1
MRTLRLRGGKGGQWDLDNRLLVLVVARSVTEDNSTMWILSLFIFRQVHAMPVTVPDTLKDISGAWVGTYLTSAVTLRTGDGDFTRYCTNQSRSQSIAIVVNEQFVDVQTDRMDVDTPPELESLAHDGQFFLPALSMRFGQKANGDNRTMTYNSQGCLWSQQDGNMQLSASLFLNDLKDLIFVFCNAGRLCSPNISQPILCSKSLDAQLGLVDCQMGILSHPGAEPSLVGSMSAGTLALIVVGVVLATFLLLWLGAKIRGSKRMQRVYQHRRLSEAPQQGNQELDINTNLNAAGEALCIQSPRHPLMSPRPHPVATNIALVAPVGTVDHTATSGNSDPTVTEHGPDGPDHHENKRTTSPTEHTFDFSRSVSPVPSRHPSAQDFANSPAQ